MCGIAYCPSINTDTDTDTNHHTSILIRHTHLAENMSPTTNSNSPLRLYGRKLIIILIIYSLPFESTCRTLGIYFR